MSAAQLEPLAGQLLSHLFAILEKPVSEENEYVMKGRLITKLNYTNNSKQFFNKL